MTTPGKIIRMKWITREYVQQNPDTYFVFGDNMVKRGYGGQAKSMRGEFNAIGVPTKWFPSMEDIAFFRDKDLDNRDVANELLIAFKTIIEALNIGANVVIPTDGLGTGLSQLPTRAPRIAEWIDKMIAVLEKQYPNI